MYSDCTVHRRNAEEVGAGFPRTNETQEQYKGDIMVFRRTVLIKERSLASALTQDWH